VRKEVSVIDGGLLQDAASVRLNILNAMHFTAEVWFSVKASTVKNCFKKSAFLFDDLSLDVLTDDTVVDETEEEDWQLDVKFIDYVTCDNAVELCAVQTVDQMLDEHQKKRRRRKKKKLNLSQLLPVCSSGTRIIKKLSNKV
jgi:hypothetical protein